MIRSVQHLRRLGNIVGMHLLPIAVVATSTFAQPTVPSGTIVRITLADNAIREGRLIHADSASLTLVSNDTLRIDRGQILAMSQRSLRTGTYARRAARTAIIPGAVLGMFVVAIASGEDRPVNWDAKAVAGLGAVGIVSGAIGASIGAITGAAVGSLVHGWTPVSSSVVVTNPSASGVNTTEPCGSGPRIDGGIGMGRGGETSTRVAVALTCTPHISGGAEVGSLGGKRDGTSENFVGAFTEFAVGHAMLNPRIVTSVGAYHETDPPVANAVRWRPGIGIGLSVATPVMRHVSIGAESRAHFSGNGNAWLTVGLSGRFRP